MAKKTTKPPKRKKNKLPTNVGRPTTFDFMVACGVCELIASGLSARKACRVIGIPHTTFVTWLVADREGIYDHYARARAAQAELQADDLIRLADNADILAPQKAKLQIDTRKWVISKMAPKRFGEKTQHEVTGADGGPITHKHTLDPALQEVLDAVYLPK